MLSIKEHYDYIRFNVSKEKGEEIRQYAQNKGLTVRELMLAALEEYKKNIGDKENEKKYKHSHDIDVYSFVNFLVLLIISVLLILPIIIYLKSILLKIILSLFIIFAAMWIEEKYISIAVNKFISKIIERHK